MDELSYWKERCKAAEEYITYIKRLLDNPKSALIFRNEKDYITKWQELVNNPPEVKYGCWCGLTEYDKKTPENCVIDTEDYEWCPHAKEGMQKESCKYWRPIGG